MRKHAGWKNSMVPDIRVELLFARWVLALLNTVQTWLFASSKPNGMVIGEKY
jgi:hypothetical protein